MTKAVMSTVGPDQPGIVAALCDVLQQHGCNIEDSTMTRLGNEFATILLLNVPAGVSLDVLREDFVAVESAMAMTIALKPADDHTFTQAAPTRPYMISVAGRDRTGITHQVARLLADHQVNITDLNAHLIDGEDGPVYIMMVEADLPATLSQETLESSLKALASELSIEISLRPLDTVEL